MYKMLFLH